MAWRVIGIQSPARLSLRDKQLVIAQDDEVSLPIEDIDALVIDSYGVTTTANLLTELAIKATTVVICDQKHLPASVLLPYSQHSRQAKVSRQQLAMSQPLKKQMWQKIVHTKINNQADVLNYFGLDDKQLRQYAKDVKSNDSTNRESLAARIYFSQLLDDATRRKPMWHNSALNYGYAMVRSHIARHIAARGLITSQGIFHHSELNGFNLVDDLIEPYRAIVDKYVIELIAPSHIGSDDSSLNKEDRKILVDILNYPVIINNKKFTIKHAINITVESFIDSIYKTEASRLLLPKIYTS
ncbi:subtype II CRISPR-associated endonuclease Cas1 [Candidatus Saccharibacteria bacterium]|nr:MAG: subtype II CRISPR-associated endonuclease Cas1 [Candidatus Saccharibacteria bacterium]